MRKYLIILLCLLATACHEPGSQERFIKGTGPFVFTVDMSDTTATYDFDLYTRLEGDVFPPELELLMRWSSPSDSVYQETVFLPLSNQVYAPYRSGVAPSEPGIWMLTISAPSCHLIPDFRGLGLVVEKKK